MTAPGYALCTNFHHLPRATLDAFLAEVQAHPPFAGYQVVTTGIPNPTNAQKAHAREHAHEAWLKAMHQASIQGAAARSWPAGAAAAPTRTRGGPKSITGAPGQSMALEVWRNLPLCPTCQHWLPLGWACPHCAEKGGQP
jgi:hypothetical protein